MRVGIPVYDGVNLLDVAGPMEIFFWAGRDHPLETVLVSADGAPVISINGVRFEVNGSFETFPALDILWVPGGDVPALERLMATPNTAYLRYLRQVGSEAIWVCSVCEGALPLARSGLLDGYEATTHWAFVECLRRFPEVRVNAERRRYVVSGNRLTGGGISAGIDEALKLVSLLFGDEAAEDVQATTEYFPDPPVAAKLPTAAPACGVRWN